MRPLQKAIKFQCQDQIRGVWDDNHIIRTLVDPYFPSYFLRNRIGVVCISTFVSPKEKPTCMYALALPLQREDKGSTLIISSRLASTSRLPLQSSKQSASERTTQATLPAFTLGHDGSSYPPTAAERTAARCRRRSCCNSVQRATACRMAEMRRKMEAAVGGYQ